MTQCGAWWRPVAAAATCTDSVGGPPPASDYSYVHHSTLYGVVQIDTHGTLTNEFPPSFSLLQTQPRCAHSNQQSRGTSTRVRPPPGRALSVVRVVVRGDVRSHKSKCEIWTQLFQCSARRTVVLACELGFIILHKTNRHIQAVIAQNVYSHSSFRAQT